MPGTVLNTLPMLFHLLLITTPEGGYDSSPHLINEDTEARDIRPLGKGHKVMRIASVHSQMP